MPPFRAVSNSSRIFLGTSFEVCLFNPCHSHTRVKFLPFCSFDFLCRKCFTATVPLALQMLLETQAEPSLSQMAGNLVLQVIFLNPSFWVMLLKYTEWGEKDGEGETLPPRRNTELSLGGTNATANKQINNILSRK